MRDTLEISWYAEQNSMHSAAMEEHPAPQNSTSNCLQQAPSHKKYLTTTTVFFDFSLLSPATYHITKLFVEKRKYISRINVSAISVNEMEENMLLTGAEIIAEVLIEQNATTIFGYPGGAVLNIYDALYKYRDQISVTS